jgi:hypothetical protein
VVPPSVDSPHPFPTVPYQISPRDPNASACTKFQEMEVLLVVSWRMDCQVSDPTGRR